MTSYVSPIARLLSFDANALYTTSVFEGLAFRPLQSAEHANTCEGVMFFNEAGTPIFGMYGRSMRSFRAQKLITVLKKPTPMPTGQSSVSYESRPDPLFKAFYVRDTLSFHRQSVSDYQSINFDLEWAEGVYTATVTTPGHKEVGKVLTGMEIIAMNADDGQFCTSSPYGGFLHNFLPQKAGHWGSTPVGWLTKQLDISEVGRGILAQGDKMVSDAPSKVQKYLRQAIQEYLRSPASKRKRGTGVTTGFFYSPSTSQGTNVTGLAGYQTYSYPYDSAIAAGHATVSIGVKTICPVSGPGLPLHYIHPVVRPCGDPSGTTLVTDIKTGHLMAKSIDTDRRVVDIQYAAGNDFEEVFSAIGAEYSQYYEGYSPPPDVIVPGSAEAEGLTPEEIAAGKPTLNNISLKSGILPYHINMPFGFNLLVETHNDVMQIYKNAEKIGKKDLK